MEDSSNKGPLQVSARKRTEVLFVARSVKAKSKNWMIDEMYSLCCGTYMVIYNVMMFDY